MTGAMTMVRAGSMPQIGLPWRIPPALVGAERDDETAFVNVRIWALLGRGPGGGAYLTEARERVVILGRRDLRERLR